MPVIVTGGNETKTGDGFTARRRGAYLTRAVVHHGLLVHAQLLRDVLEGSTDLWRLAMQECASVASLDDAWQALLSKIEKDASFVLADVKEAVTFDAQGRQVERCFIPRREGMTLDRFCALYYELAARSECDEQCVDTVCGQLLQRAILRFLEKPGRVLAPPVPPLTAVEVNGLHGVAAHAVSLLFSMYMVLCMAEVLGSDLVGDRVRFMLRRCGRRLCRVVDTGKDDVHVDGDGQCDV